MIGELYAGIGGLGIATEHALGLRTAWQLDQVGADVRRRHWPDAVQVEADVATVDPLDLPPVSVLVGGFACQDLSTAGKGAGLDAGSKTGPTYRHLCRFASVLSPDLVIMENVPALLTKWRERLEEDWRALGYGLTWVRCGAWDAGAPHIRRRVFVVAEKRGQGRGVLDAPQDGRWAGDRTWPTMRADEARTSGGRTGRDAEGESLTYAVRPWPTPTAGDAKASGSRCLDSGAHDGTSLTDAVRPDRAVAGERLWATATQANPNEGEDPASWAARSRAVHAGGSRPVSEPLAQQVALLPTPAARDYKVGSGLDRVGTPPLSEAAAPTGGRGRRLNPDWVETLMGYPVGWTETTGPRLDAERVPGWPRGRYPAGWDRTQHWPGYDWEPSRTVPDGPPVPGRPARLRALGNAVVPQQGALAIKAALSRG